MTTVIGSIARAADFERRPAQPEARERALWRTGDFVICEMVAGEVGEFQIELPSGEQGVLRPGDRLIGALGARAATLQVVGDWRAAEGEDLETLNVAGVLGKCTSIAVGAPRPARLRYVGHAVRDGSVCTMRSVLEEPPERELTAPVILIIGTSMEAGKTVAAVALTRALKSMGLRVAGVKVTGVGRFRDIRAMGAAGADFIADFVDAGLPSTVVPRDEYEAALRRLGRVIAAAEPDVVIAEAGASPLEPYNGEFAVRYLADRVSATVLCASDPYAVVGVIQAFGSTPDLISGRATSTKAAIDLIGKLVDIPALNMLDPESAPKIEAFLRERLRGVLPTAVSGGEAAPEG